MLGESFNHLTITKYKTKLEMYLLIILLKLYECNRSSRLLIAFPKIKIVSVIPYYSFGIDIHGTHVTEHDVHKMF